MRAVVLFEAMKGILVLISGFGLLALVHRDVEAIAARLIAYTHLNPAHHYPQIFLQAASHVTDAKLLILAAMAGLYAVVRCIEAYGLWHMKAWAEWFAVISGGIYIPIELYDLATHPTLLTGIVLLINTLIVVYVGFIVVRQRSKSHVK
jgi:uncharacterized membrane protein (DUF2068 family)